MREWHDSLLEQIMKATTLFCINRWNTNKLAINIKNVWWQNSRISNLIKNSNKLWRNTLICYNASQMYYKLWEARKGINISSLHFWQIKKWRGMCYHHRRFSYRMRTFPSALSLTYQNSGNFIIRSWKL